MSTEIANRESVPFQWMDAKDDEAIVLELKGVKSTALVYEFPQGGKLIRGLSKVGVDEATRELAVGRGEVLRVLGQAVWRLEGEYYEVTVTAGRFAVAPDGREIALDTTIGAKRQWVNMELRTGQVVPDPFAFEKAISKAVRNAKHALLPVDIIEAVIVKGKAAGRTTTAPATTKRVGSANATLKTDKVALGDDSSATQEGPQDEQELAAESGDVLQTPAEVVFENLGQLMAQVNKEYHLSTAQVIGILNVSYLAEIRETYPDLSVAWDKIVAAQAKEKA